MQIDSISIFWNEFNGFQINNPISARSILRDEETFQKSEKLIRETTACFTMHLYLKQSTTYFNNV